MQGPYRPQPPPPDPELARLAMEGQRRRMEMESGQRVEQNATGNATLRTAIGAYRGSTLRRIMLAALIGGLLCGISGIALVALGEGEIGGFLTPGFAVAFICVFLVAFVPPLASQGAVAAEQEWTMALPFQLDGYFAALSGQPTYSKQVRYEIVWRDGVMPPDPNLVHSIIGAVDPQARLERSDSHGTRITSGDVSGSTGISVNRSPVYRNHRLCKSIHGVVDQVLVPLHRTYPIARVTVRA